MVRMSYIGHMNRHVIDLLDFDQADRMRKAREENWLITGDSNLEPSDYRTTDDGINVWGWAA